MAEKLCLQWNDFQENIKAVFGAYRSDNDFADVTLACEDGYQIEAHKVFLAATSPFFKSLLQRTKTSHPIVFMRGMKRGDLDAIVDFLYYGEANVYQENLDAFLALAEELKLKGLSGEDVGEKTANVSSASPNRKQSMKPTQKLSNVSSKEYLIAKTEPSDFDARTSKNNTLSLPASSTFSEDLKELEEKVTSMVEKSEKRITVGKQNVTAFKCKICGKEGMNTDIKRHIESAHMEGLSIPCNFCDKTCRSRKGLIDHIARHHKR